MRVTGADGNSAQRFLIDAGAIYYNYGEDDELLIGATQEGATFTLEQDVRQVAVDGHRAPIVDARRVISETARITAQIMEMTSENLYRIIMGADVSLGNTHKTTRRMSDLPNADQFLTNVALVGRAQGTDDRYVFILFNALNDGGFEIETSDEREGTLGVQFTGHTPMNDPDSSPWEIRTPTAIDSPATT